MQLFSQRIDVLNFFQDPNHLEKFNIEQFHHVKLDLKTKSEIEAEKKAMKDPKFYIRRMNNETREVLDKLAKEYVPEVSLYGFYKLKLTLIVANICMVLVNKKTN